MYQDYRIRNQCYSGRCLSIVTWYFCDGRVNKFSLLLSRSSCPRLNPIMCLVGAERRLDVAHGASLFSASSEVSWADGSLPSVLSPQNEARHQVQQPRSSDPGAGEEGRQTSLISNRMPLCGFRRLPPKEVLPYFQDKVSFMKAMC